MNSPQWVNATCWNKSMGLTCRITIPRSMYLNVIGTTNYYAVWRTLQFKMSSKNLHMWKKIKDLLHIHSKFSKPTMICVQFESRFHRNCGSLMERNSDYQHFVISQRALIHLAALARSLFSLSPCFSCVESQPSGFKIQQSICFSRKLKPNEKIRQTQ